jgi:hypothetical protein
MGIGECSVIVSGCGADGRGSARINQRFPRSLSGRTRPVDFSTISGGLYPLPIPRKSLEARFERSKIKATIFVSSGAQTPRTRRSSFPPSIDPSRPCLINVADVYKADVGRQVRSARLQSIPSSSIDSCAWVSETLPLFACGQTKRQRSRRFATRHRPSPDHHNTLSISPRRPRNTNTWPQYGSWANAVRLWRPSRSSRNAC